MSGRKVCETCERSRPLDFFDKNSGGICLHCEGLRRCTKCQQWIDWEDFSKSGKGKSGRVYKRSECQRCEREARATQRATERGRRLKREQDARRWARIKQALVDLRQRPARATDSAPLGPPTAPRSGHRQRPLGPPTAPARATDSAPLGPPTAPARAADSAPLGPPKIGRPSVAQLNAAALAAVPAKATAKVWASGHDPADYPGFAPHLFDLPGFDPLDLSTWPDDSL